MNWKEKLAYDLSYKEIDEQKIIDAIMNFQEEMRDALEKYDAKYVDMKVNTHSKIIKFYDFYIKWNVEENSKITLRNDNIERRVELRTCNDEKRHEYISELFKNDDCIKSFNPILANQSNYNYYVDYVIKYLLMGES